MRVFTIGLFLTAGLAAGQASAGQTGAGEATAPGAEGPASSQASPGQTPPAALAPTVVVAPTMKVKKGPTLQKMVDPEYTEEARQEWVVGSVLVVETIDAEGMPQNIRVERGLGHGLDEKAVEAVRRWQYNPATEDGKPVPFDARIDVAFRLPPPSFDIAAIPVALEAAASDDPVRRDRALKALRVVAAGGNVDAQFFLGSAYDYGEHGLTESKEDSRRFFEACARAGRVDCRFRLGRLYLYWPGRRAEELADAYAWLELAAEAGSQDAKNLLEIEPAKLSAHGRDIVNARKDSYRAARAPDVPSPGVQLETGKPRIKSQAEPKYSEEARKDWIVGKVRLRVVVDTEGMPESIGVVQGLGFGLDEKATEAIKQWSFEPAMKDGKPVVEEMTIAINFHITVDQPEKVRAALPQALEDAASGDALLLPGALKTIRQAATLDDAGAQFFLAGAYETGAYGVEENLRVSRYEYLRCAPHKVECLYGLGELLLHLPDRKWREQLDAYAWLELAAEAGSVAAKNLLMREPSQLTAQEREFVDQHKKSPGGFQTVVYATPLTRVEPKYTEEARKRWLTGTVSLMAYVDTAGKPTEVKVATGLGSGLDEAAVDAVRQWRFTPGTLDGTTVDQQISVPVRFDLPVPEREKVKRGLAEALQDAASDDPSRRGPALETIYQAAALRDADARYFLADAFENGLYGIEKNEKESQRRFAECQDQPRCMYRLGRALLRDSKESGRAGAYSAIISAAEDGWEEAKAFLAKEPPSSHLTAAGQKNLESDIVNMHAYKARIKAKN